MFDPSKESKHILSRFRSRGDNFTILGINFDCKLLMTDAIHDCVIACGWKLESILRCKHFFTDSDLVLFFKSHLLSFIEYRTPGIFHAAASHLQTLDRVLSRFLNQLHISSLDALMNFNLAPLDTRRAIAMLGVIHRAARRDGPNHFHRFF